MSANFYKNEMDREMLLNIEIQKQNLKSLPEKFKAQKKVVSPVTQQMIDDYKQQFMDSYKRKDDKGSSKFYKFLIPEAEPTLEIIDKDELLKSGTLKQEFTVDVIKKKLIDLNLADELTQDRSIDDIKDQINYLAFTVYPDQEQGLRDQYRIIEESKIKINKLTAKKRALMIKYSDEYIDNLSNKRSELIRDYGKNVKEIKEIETEINRVKTERFNAEYLAEDIKNIDEKIKNNEERIKIANETIPMVIINLENITTQINQLTRIIEENDENKLYNEKVLYTIEQNNKKKLADYAKTIQIMNNGEISLEQQQGESEADYLKRLSEVALIEEDPTRAFLYNTNQFKKNLKTLIKSEWKIENLIKTFSNDDQFLLNKTFAGFKKYFTNLYGPGNKDLDVEEYVNIIRDYIDSPATSLLKKKEGTREESSELERLKKKYVEPYADEETKSDDDEVVDRGLLLGDRGTETTVEARILPGRQETETVVASNVEDLPEVEARAIPPPPPPISERTLQNIKISKEGDVLRFENIANNNNLYFKLEDPKTGSGEKQAGNIIKYSNDNKTYIDLGKGSAFNGKLDTRIKSLGLSDNDSDFQVIRYRIVGLKTNITATDFINFFNSYKEGSGFKKSKKPKKPKKQLVVQKGASIKDVPNKCEFGKLIILLNKLYHNNILSVKDKNGINVQGIPNSKVDDKFVDIIMKICNNEDVNKNDVLVLNDKDAILYSVLMNKSGLKKKYNIDNSKSIKALKDRLELVEGEMLAGNTNNDIQKELYDIVFKLANLGATTLSSARKYYKNTSKLMFKN